MVRVDECPGVVIHIDTWSLSTLQQPSYQPTSTGRHPMIERLFYAST
jgi:hypothetical protein